MVKCDVLLLAVSIFLSVGRATTLTYPQSAKDAAPPRSSDTDSAIPIHRVILLLEPAKDLADPLVIRLYNESLAQKAERKRKRNLPRPKLSTDDNATAKFALPGKRAAKPTVDPRESISTEQLTALADLYLTDALTDRLTARYRITVLDPKTVNTALAALQLSREQAAGSEGAQKLCSSLECDAVVDVGVPVLTTINGQTRDLVMRVDVRLAALRDPNGGFVTTHKPRGITPQVGHGHTKPRVDFVVAAAGVSYRAFMSSGYTTSFPGLAEQAATQAAALALHTLSTGEPEPFANAGTRVAIAPAYGPDRADMLVLSGSGRHTEIGAVRSLPTDIAGLFRPDLMPVLTNEVVGAAVTANEMRTASISPSLLWRDNYNPNIEAIRVLGSRLKVQYMLVAHITDLDVATAPATENGRQGYIVQEEQSAQSEVRPWERQAHAEACGALIRIRDGELVWSDRGDTTVTSRDRVSAATRASANRGIAIDAEKFALIDLKRRFAAFRSQFEQ